MATGAILFIGSYALCLFLLAYTTRPRKICIDTPKKALFSWSRKTNMNNSDFKFLDLATKHEGGAILNVYEDNLIKLTIKPSFVYASFTLENKTEDDIKIIWNDLYVSYSTMYGGKALHSSVIGKSKKDKQSAETIKAGGRMVDFIKPYMKHYSHTTPIDIYMDTDRCEQIIIPLVHKRKRITYCFVIKSRHAYHNDRKYVIYLRKKEEELMRLRTENIDSLEILKNGLLTKPFPTTKFGYPKVDNNIL